MFESLLLEVAVTVVMTAAMMMVVVVVFLICSTRSSLTWQSFIVGEVKDGVVIVFITVQVTIIVVQWRLLK
jgi:hypothetical protein